MKLENPIENYRKTNTTVYSCRYHVIFCPKYRRKILTGDIEDFLKKRIPELCSSKGCEVLEIEIMPDHVHLLLDVNPDFGVKNLVSRIKSCTAKEMYKKFPQLRKSPAIWTRSKFVSTIGSVSLETVKRYIQNQK